MKLLTIVTLLTIVALAVSIKVHKNKRNHEFIDMFTKDPGMMIDIASGDYLTLLPDSIEPFVRKVLGKEKKTGVAGFLDTAKGLLGGGNKQSPLDSLMGGQSAGSGFANVLGGLTGGSSGSSSSKGGLSSLLGSFTGGSSAGSSAGGISSLLNTFGGSDSQKKQSSGGIGGFFGNLFHEKAQIEHKSAKARLMRQH